MGVDLKGVKREFCGDEKNYKTVYAERNGVVGREKLMTEERMGD